MKYPQVLFSQSDRHPKIVKSEKEVGVHMKVLHLAPAKSSGKYNVCPKASKGCEAACLNWAGFQYSRKQLSRIRKTILFMDDRREFVARLAKEIYNARRYARKRGMICGIRLNGTSDIRWETIRYGGKNLMEHFPDVCFMDYTKIANRRDLPPNYRLTFSRSESNEADCWKAIENGMNVAVVFGTPYMPKTFMGLRVIDGDAHDWRYGEYDLYPGERVIVGLRPKGLLAKNDKTGFVFRH